ncbi:FecR family protein [Cellulophaga sp. HaHaR_3_176]|uniref:FecR family protein n=1 Tax=Cellulophaga sp. HaHaR_3_176 TaxID=1942464 RepID=UPI001C1FDDB9|nr:FecR family protein [Cellulophaga sp. HaHaR_3_176]QWX84625.1 FecR family protein [Cellulophaga sp. HaHaR_3_176]
MIKDEINICLLKYLNNSATGADLDILNNWIQKPSNEILFKEYIETHFAITMSMNKADSSEIRRKLLKEIRKEKNLFYRIKPKSILKYAAVGFFFLGMGYIFQIIIGESELENIPLPTEEAITLELENGNIKIISEDGSTKIVDVDGQVVGKQKGQQLVYSNDVGVSKESYNTLTVPYGKRFDLNLSDGTKVHLNAGSSLRYPVKFLPGKIRQVFLKGEAYFDVAENKKNPFIVNAYELNVQVVGTEFNVVAYPENVNTDVILIEGSVGLYESNEQFDIEKNTMLKPGFKASFDKEHKTINTGKVNTTLYTSWIDGTIFFRNEPFDNIIKSLERQYNTTIINNNKTLGNETFNASIEVERESLEEVLNYFNKVYAIEYQVVNNKVIIN